MINEVESKQMKHAKNRVLHFLSELTSHAYHISDYVSVWSNNGSGREITANPSNSSIPLL